MQRIDQKLIVPIVEPSEDKAHRLARATIATIPVLGGSLLEVFNSIIEPPLARRKTEWMIQITSAVNSLLEKKIITEDDLKTNEKFFTTLVHASSVALKNHQNEKIQALRNATINSALPDSPDDATQQMFLNLIDTITPWHIAFLRLFQDPNHWAIANNHKFPNMSVGGLSTLLESAFPQLAKRRELYDLIWSELYRSGLVSIQGLHTTMSGTGLYAKRTTLFGDEFMNFISEPKF